MRLIKKRFGIPIFTALLVLSFAFTGCAKGSSNAQTITSSISVQSKTQCESSQALESSSALPSTSSKTLSKPSSSAPIVLADSSTLKVNYLDVGQGDSEFIEFPNGKTMLIDAGNPENDTEIVAYIKGLKHSKIDYLIVTHPHADHIGGMSTIVKNFDIGEIYMPRVADNQIPTTTTYQNFLYAISDKGLKITQAKAGLKLIDESNLKVDMLSPTSNTYKNMNDYSAVIKITYGSTSFLFMGDSSNISENQITADNKADVLKVGHHGSKTSSSAKFLKKVNPKYAVISVGKDNKYGHPAAETLKKLSIAGIQTYRTDQTGTILFTSDGKTITINKKASATKENAPPASSKPTTPPSQKPSVVAPPKETNDNQSVTVYVTNTGSKYHTGGCQYLRKSKSAISLDDAKSSGYTPCSKCHPPQ